MTILCKPDDCTLLVVDPQTRLMPAIHDGESVVRRCVQLATAAKELGIHVIGTEQNPDGLGPLVPEIATLCDTVLAKFHFSAVAEEGFMQRLPAGFAGKPWRQTDGAVFSVVEGQGVIEMEAPSASAGAGAGSGGVKNRFSFGPRDHFVVPSWHTARLHSASGCVLFSYSDRPVHQALGIHKEERLS